MARQTRFSLPHQTKYIMQKGNDYTPLFTFEKDFQFYLLKLSELCYRYDCDIHAYVLLPYQVHLLLTPGSSNSISKIMQSLSRAYTKYFNQYNDRKGTLWDGRYKASLVSPKEYLLACMQYIEQIPVQSGLCNQPDQYKWSSNAHNCGIVTNSLISPHEIYLNHIQNTPDKLKSYKTLSSTPLPKADIDYILNAINGGWVMGGSEFCRIIESLSQRRAAPKERGGDRRSIDYIKTIHKTTGSN